MTIQEFDERVPLNLIAYLDENWNPASGYQFSFPNDRNARFDYILGFNKDTVGHIVTFKVWDQQDGAKKFIGSVTLPAGSGFTTLPPVDILAQLLATTNRAIVMLDGQPVEIFLSAAPAAGTYVSVWVRGGWF